MAFNLKHYYAGVRAEEEKLPAELFIMSLDDPSGTSVAGVVTHVPRRLAAKQIVEGVARPATDKEIAAHKEGQHATLITNATLERDRILAMNPFASLRETEAPGKEKTKPESKGKEKET